MRTLPSFVLILSSLLFASPAMAELNCGVHFGNTRELAAHPIHRSLKEAAERPVKDPVSYVEFEGVRLPKYSKTSKWRAVVVLPHEDLISHRGYESGFFRNGDDVPSPRKAKYNDQTSDVDYEFADGRQVRVTPREARALEFSYLDAKNPKSALNSIVVGLHDDPEKILKVIKQSGAQKLLNENAYIRLDEIETTGLDPLSAESLYKKFDLQNPNYSPKGEWVVDRSIPPEHLLSTFKFKSVAELDAVDLEIGEVVSYKALSGNTYVGRIESTTVRDGFVTVNYLDKFGNKQMDIAQLRDIKKQSHLVEGSYELKLSGPELENLLATRDYEALIVMLKREESMGFLFSAPSGLKPRTLIADHAVRVIKDLEKSYADHLSTRGMMVGPREKQFLSFISKVILVHEIGQPISSALRGSAAHTETTAVLARRFFEHLGMTEDEIQRGLGIIKRGDLEKYSSIGELLKKVDP